MMRTAMLALAGVMTMAAAPAPPPLKDFAASAEVQALIATAKAERRPDQPTHIQRLLTLQPYAANLEYRAAVGPAAVHEKEAELFFVVEGSASVTTGGRLTGETRTNAENLSGSGVEGGSVRKVAKGDLFIVPENTPHWFNAIDGVVVLISLHVPRG